MADKNITVVLKAKDQASAAVRGLRGEFDKMRKNGGLTKAFMGGVGLSAGLGAMSAITTGISTVADAVGGLATGLLGAADAAREEDAEIAQLSRTLDNNVHGWRMQSEALDAAVKAGQELGFADSDLRRSIGTLSLSTGSLTEDFRLLTGVQDLARDRNISLEQATKAVSKAYQGQFGALKKLGFQIEKGADRTKVLRDVFARVEGAASLFANTAAGKLAVSVQHLGDAFEDLGREMPITGDEFTRMRVDWATEALKILYGVAHAVNVVTGNVESFDKNAFILNATWMGVTKTVRESQAALEAMSEEGLARAAAEAKKLSDALDTVVGSTKTTEKAWRKLLRPGDENKKSIRELTKDLEMWRRRERQALEDGDQQRWAVARANRTRTQEELDQHKTIRRAFQHDRQALDEVTQRRAEAAKKRREQEVAARRQARRTAWAVKVDEAQKQFAMTATNVKLQIQSQKIRALREQIEKVNTLPDAWWDFHLGIPPGFGGIFNPLIHFLGRNRARGGPVAANTSYIVGERGPEVFTPRMSGNITPNGRGGGCNHPVYIDGELMTHWVMRKLGQQAMWAAG